LAEIGIEELRRLARNFLVGKGGEAELEDTKRAMDSDPQLAMEFLQQMQTALEDSAPAGFSPEQWKEIDHRVEGLITPLAKGGLSLGFIGKFFSRLFKKKPVAEGPSRIKKGGAPRDQGPKAAASESPTSLLSSEPVVAPPIGDAGDGMEEMAPIAPAAAPAPVAVAAPAAEPESRPAVKSARAPRSKKPLLALLGLLLLGLAGWGAWLGFKAWQARPKAAPPAPAPLPTPVLKPTPYSGPQRRLLPPADQKEPLPSELPPMTPQPAGNVNPIPNLDAKDQQGHRGLPLP
jgi:hypothetical protein